MPKCKYCEKTISKQDYDLCPYCGGANPIDPDYKTQNITQVVFKKENEGLYKSKSKKIAVLLSCLLGPFGAAFFYLKYKRKAILSLISGILSLAAFSLLTVFVWRYAIIIAAVILWGFHIAYGIFIAKSHAYKDGEGEYLR